ncbi:pyruvate kinase alpha/beta domain-containing protein [Desulfoscipio sp. XC116]|uniref:pyruvate kinase alpha/beta domain-containing protein n=1 Tax=Desulfoscipio sp. XC116 TaxID=3144975 RepID=UPI00325AF000
MYWEKKGPDNTDATIKAALDRAAQTDIRYIVVASSTGNTALKLIDCSRRVICVSYHVGFDSPGSKRMNDETIAELNQKGIRVLFTTHLLAGVDRAMRNKFGGVYPAEIMAQTLRMLGQGVKVCVEISGMALDAGLIPYGEDIIAIGGSGKGADTAVVIAPAHSNHFFDTKIKEIICKPGEF